MKKKLAILLALAVAATLAFGTVAVADEPFTGCLDRGERVAVDGLVVSAGATDVSIQLDADADLDLELWGGKTHVVGWKAEIDSMEPCEGTYKGDVFSYSGWDGGDEYITADGPLSRDYTVKVYGYEAGCYEVGSGYVEPGPDEDPPTITITARDTSLGDTVTITVSANDISGVAWLVFSIHPDTYPEGWSGPVARLITADDSGSVTFAPLWAGTYTVGARAADTVGNETLVAAEETFVVE